jgi:rhodanese-related sulfurtransferase
MPFSDITVQELSQRLNHPNLQFVDVREPWEVETASLTSFVNLPLSQFDQWSEQIYSHLEPETETLVLCHHGVRSAQMCHWLTQQGFTNVKNIAGGIDAYSIAVDRAIPRY